MKKRAFFYHTVLMLAFCFITVPDLSAQNKRKALFVIVDGISADVIEKLETPALDLIARRGGYSRAYVGGEKQGYSQTPTISAVGYNSLLTGTWVNKHNVWGNEISDPNYNYPTIFRLLKTERPEAKVAVFSTWLDNRTRLLGEALEGTGRLQLDDYFDGLELDTLNYPHDADSRYIHLIDEAVTDTASARIRRNGYDLSWVYLQYTDDMGHRYGDSEPFYEAVRIMDRQVKRIYDAVEYRRKQFNEEWVVYVTTDHGRDAQTGKGHGGQSDRERSIWIITDAKDLNPYFKAGTPAIVDIMPSIASFLKLKIPRAQAMEIDGVPITGKVSASSLSAVLNGNRIMLNWKSIDKKGLAKIWIADSNHYKTGGKDEYRLVKEVELANEKAELDLKAGTSNFYKIVIEAPHNFLNRWVSKDSSP